MMRIKPKIDEAKAKNGLKVFVGGPSAWQWLYFPELMNYFGIDMVFDGEAEKLVVDMVERAINGEPIPKYLYVAGGTCPALMRYPQ